MSDKNYPDGLAWYQANSGRRKHAASWLKLEKVAEIMKRQDDALPAGADDIARSAWTLKWLDQYPDERNGMKLPTDLKDYTAQEKLAFINGDGARKLTNPRGYRKPDPSHPAKKKRGEI